jgi:TolA-binding protein
VSKDAVSYWLAPFRGETMGNPESLCRELEEALGANLARLSVQVAPAPNQLVTSAQQAKRLELQMQKRCAELREKSSRGLGFCLKRLEELTTEKAAFVKESLKKAFLPLQTKEEVQRLTELVALGNTWKELLGVSLEVLDALYKAAKSFLESGQYQEAEDAFSYLVLIDHSSYCFWLGLGISRSQLQQQEAAQMAFKVASELAPDNQKLGAL